MPDHERIFRADWNDAQQLAREHETFEAPSEEELDRVAIGANVKISDGLDRFWVQVTAITGNTLQGTVNNELVSGQEYGLGDLVEFERRHIYDAPAEETLTEAAAAIQELIGMGYTPEQALKVYQYLQHVLP